MYYILEGRLGQRMLPRLAVASSSFSNLGWVAQWGAEAVVYAGFGLRDHLRAAIQLLSEDVERRRVYSHLGWRKLDGRWAFLHGGGAIGADGDISGVDVRPEGVLSQVRLPAPPTGEELRRAVQASLELLEVAPPRVAFPLLAAIYRAPLCEALPADFTVYLVGPTGVGKTSIAAIAQAHYGAGLDDRSLLAGWESTGNALERLMHLAKDVLLVVDDFAPKGSTADVQRLHREADRVLRAQGNRLGRHRLKADGTARPAYVPRGLVLSTGEDVPSGQSLRARLVVVDVAKGDVDFDVLSTLQLYAEEGIFAQSMAGFVRWLAPRLDELEEGLTERRRELRGHAVEKVRGHPRTSDATAQLFLAWEQFLQYAEVAGAIDATEREELRARGWEALIEVGEEQAAHQEQEDPVELALTSIRSALASGRVHVRDAETGEQPRIPAGAEQLWGWELRRVGSGEHEREEWRPRGRCIGYLAERKEKLWLDPQETYATICTLLRDEGRSFPVGPHTLWKRMAERGLIRREHTTRRAHNTVRREVLGERRRVVALHYAAVLRSLL